jgi:hypothetical protein
LTLGVVPGNIGFNFSFTCKPATNLRFSLSFLVKLSLNSRPRHPMSCWSLP